MEQHSDFIVFSDDEEVAAGEAHRAAAPAPWRVLIVDDDEDVHNATEFALTGLRILERSVEFLHAYSATDAIDLLMHEQDVAVILLDVVMESEDAGLAAVTTIRRDLGLSNVQIILRTGQPGYAPELETIRRYEINDYRTKSELSRVKLYTALTSAVRAYDQLRRIDADRQALEAVVDAGNQLLGAGDAGQFARLLLGRAAALLGLPCRGFVCVQTSGAQVLVHVDDLEGFATGRELGEQDGRQEVREIVTEALSVGRTLIDQRGYALCFHSPRSAAFVAYLAGNGTLHGISRQMIDVFCNNVAVCGENINLVARLSELAFTDGLTGLASRRAFAAELDRRLTTLARGDTAVVLLDIDQFAEINDMFGHQYGDALLRAIAQRLRETAPEDVLVARLGGDTFALLGMPDQVAPHELRAAIARPFEIDGEERVVSISSGFVHAKDTGGDGNDLIKDATIVIKRAKAQGQGRHANYSPEFGEHARSRSLLLHGLGNAFRQNQLFLVYQPQVSLASGKVVGFEALLRWRTADGQYVPPDRFIPVAENSGLIVPIGNWVLSSALRDLSALRELGHTGLRMAVNVSPPQFQQPDFLERIDRALAESGSAPEALELEVTEGVSIIGIDQAIEQIAAVRGRGIAVAIDDFGTGYSSLSYLDRLQADRLKIDRAFINALGAVDGGPRIAEMVISLGRQLSMAVLAEGVETEQQALYLTDLGCHEAQGYFFAKPMPFADLKAWLEQRK